MFMCFCSGILKTRAASTAVADRNMKNRLREKLSDFTPPHVHPCSPPTNRSLCAVTMGNGVIIRLPQRPPLSPRQQHNGITMVTAMLTTPSTNRTEDGHDSESE